MCYLASLLADGFVLRRDVLAALRWLKMPVIRYPREILSPATAGLDVGERTMERESDRWQARPTRLGVLLRAPFGNLLGGGGCQI